MKFCKSHEKIINKEHQFFTNIFSILMFFVLLFHVVCKISNLNMWTAKHLVQASCTELTLHTLVSSFFLEIVIIINLWLILIGMKQNKKNVKLSAHCLIPIKISHKLTVCHWWDSIFMIIMISRKNYGAIELWNTLYDASGAC